MMTSPITTNFMRGDRHSHDDHQLPLEVYRLS
jgi:hypothetical protein